MFKKLGISSIVFLSLILIFSGNAFAKEGYWPSGEDYFYAGKFIGDKYYEAKSLTDNKESGATSLTSSNTNATMFWYEFKETVNIYEVYAYVGDSYDGGKADTNLIYYFMNDNKQVIKQLTFADFKGQRSVDFNDNPLKNIKYITMERNDKSKTALLSEFGLITDKMYKDLSNLLVVPTYEDVSLSWTKAEDNGFGQLTGYKVYRDGVFLASVDELTNVFVDEGVEENRTYTYKVTALYSDSFETKGETKAITTLEKPVDPSEIPPSNVTDLTAVDIKGTSAKLTWKNSEDLDLDKVNIYNDDHSVLASIDVVSEYVLSGLNPETTYNFYVSLVDVDGNVGPKMKVTFTTTVEIDDVPPEIPKGISVDGGSNSLYIKWDKNVESDLAGYNVYIDGVKHNSVLVKNVFYTVPNLINDKEYSVTITAVDKTGNESDFSNAVNGTPIASGLPVLETEYELKDVAVGIESWFGSLWLIIAFAISIPLSFIVASKIKLMFID